MFCRDYREMFYEEVEDILIWWFNLVYVGILFHFMYMPDSIPVYNMHLKRYISDIVYFHQMMQCMIPHYRRSYIPPFN